MVVEDTGVAAPSGVTLASRWSLFCQQLRPQSWQDAQQELQQGKNRNTLTRHRNQPGAQQHQHRRAPPAVTPRTTYSASREMEDWESGEERISLKNNDVQFLVRFQYIQHKYSIYSLHILRPVKMPLMESINKYCMIKLVAIAIIKNTLLNNYVIINYNYIRIYLY